MADDPVMAGLERGDAPGLPGEFQPLIESQLKTLSAMILPNGAVLASPNGSYKAHWVRDGLYVLTAAVSLGLSDLAHRLIRAPFSIFQKHPHLGDGLLHRCRRRVLGDRRPGRAVFGAVTLPARGLRSRDRPGSLGGDYSQN